MNALNRLFVYGTLAPGEPNEHILSGLDGTWEAGHIRGTLYPKGWGAVIGYPGVQLDPAGEIVPGQLFSSEDLAGYWQVLDDFEGEAYERVRTSVSLENGQQTEAYVYAIRE